MIHKSKEGCCGSEASIGSCSLEAKSDIEPPVSSILDLKTNVFVKSSRGSSESDVEKAENELKHLTINVRGMTCTGCEKKLNRVLNSIPAISNVKTSLNLAQAEFDVDISMSKDAIALIKTIERTSGFACSQMVKAGAWIDLIVPCKTQDLVNEVPPIGVTAISVLNHKSVRVHFNPNIIGARNLLADPIFASTKLAPITPPPAVASAQTLVYKTFLTTLVSALLTIPVLLMAWAPLPKHEKLYGAISLGLATIVQIVIAGPFYLSAFTALIFSRLIEMDLLIVLSTSAAYIYSVTAYAYATEGKPLRTGEFFETSTLLVTLIMFGRAISALARKKALEAVPIEPLQPQNALLMNTVTDQEDYIDTRLLQYEDSFKVLPGTPIATDGVIVAGETEVDESLVTGEALLVTKKPGMSVIAGSTNHAHNIIVRLTSLVGENTLKNIAVMVDQAKSSKPRIQRIADSVASCFVPAILAISMLVFIIWSAIGIMAKHQATQTACIEAMTYAISALIISCPCGIGLAVPMVVVIAGGVAAKHGLILKSAETIEITRRTRHVVFDKTGTLTQGRLSVRAGKYHAEDAANLMSMILGLTANSKHPVSVSLAAHLRAEGAQPSNIEDIETIPGCGIEAKWSGSTVRCGSPFWLDVQHSPLVRQIIDASLTTCCVCVDGELFAVFGLQDHLREDAMTTVKRLRERSIDVSIISGDHEQAVDVVARQLDVPTSHIRARCSPVDKQAYISGLIQDTAHEKGTIIFIGDGTNDAIALAQAHVGIHMNEGTEIARSAADVMLMRPKLIGILKLLDLSHAFHHRVMLNFAWAGIYNVFALLLAAGAFPKVRISPQFAGLGEIFSVVPIIAIAVGLRWRKLRP